MTDNCTKITAAMSEKDIKDKGCDKQLPISRRVSFPKSELVTGYLEPADPFKFVSKIKDKSEIIDHYKTSCLKHKTTPMAQIIDYLENMDFDQKRQRQLSLQSINFTPNDCESLEEIFKRIQFEHLNLSNCDLNDSTASPLFGMIEYYEVATELDISNNPEMSIQSWESASHMITNSQVLNTFISNGNPLSSLFASTLGKSLKFSCIHVLKLEHTGLHNLPILSLCFNLRDNITLKELYLGYNDLCEEDAVHLQCLLEENSYLQLLDISNNNLKDKGLELIIKGIIGKQKDFFGSDWDLFISQNFYNENNRSDNRTQNNNTVKFKSDIYDVNKNEDLYDKQTTNLSSAHSTLNASTDLDESIKTLSETSYSTIPINIDVNPASGKNGCSDSTTIAQSIDSLCSEEGLTFNDKFKHNDTLTRQKHVSQISGDLRKQSCSLKALIIWNNNLTKDCSKYVCELLENCPTLKVFNVGKNNLGNDFLNCIKESLNKNKNLTDLGLQSAHLSHEGIQLLFTTLKSGLNQTLQRLDLRDNYLSNDSLDTINEALDQNSSLQQIDVDDVPKRLFSSIYDGEYYNTKIHRIRSLCLKNKQIQDQCKINDVDHIKGNYNKTAATRKISLTCESYPLKFQYEKKTNKHLTDLRKLHGERLRSPLPSPPIISPSLSPVPSPSKSRFIVSKVCEPTSIFLNKPSKSRFQVTLLSEDKQKLVVMKNKPLLDSTNDLTLYNVKSENSILKISTENLEATSIAETDVQHTKPLEAYYTTNDDCK